MTFTVFPFGEEGTEDLLEETACSLMLFHLKILLTFVRYIFQEFRISMPMSAAEQAQQESTRKIVLPHPPNRGMEIPLLASSRKKSFSDR